MAGYAAFLHKRGPTWKKYKDATTAYCLDREFKVSKARMAITIETTTDKSVRKACVTILTGGKWTVQDVVNEAILA